MADPHPAIELRGLTRSFGPALAVDGLTFSVGRGERFGFLGPNGSGKTTTVKMLCTLLRPTAGRAEVAGHDVAAAPGAVRRSLGVLFQDPSLDPKLTAEENLDFYARLYCRGWTAAARRAEIDRVLDLAELADRRRAMVYTFSWGMKRRLEIARALLPSPAVLLLDEPTTGLDLQAKTRIWADLHRLQEELGITIFLTTHDMDEAEECDRVGILDHGRLLALGAPAQVAAPHGGRLRDAFLALTGTGLRDEAAAARERVRHRE